MLNDRRNGPVAGDWECPGADVSGGGERRNLSRLLSGPFASGTVFLSGGDHFTSTHYHKKPTSPLWYYCKGRKACVSGASEDPMASRRASGVIG